MSNVVCFYDAGWDEKQYLIKILKKEQLKKI